MNCVTRRTLLDYHVRAPTRSELRSHGRPPLLRVFDQRGLDARVCCAVTTCRGASPGGVLAAFVDLSHLRSGFEDEIRIFLKQPLEPSAHLFTLTVGQRSGVESGQGAEVLGALRQPSRRERGLLEVHRFKAREDAKRLVHAAPLFCMASSLHALRSSTRIFIASSMGLVSLLRFAVVICWSTKS